MRGAEGPVGREAKGPGYGGEQEGERERMEGKGLGEQGRGEDLAVGTAPCWGGGAGCPEG